MRLSTFISSNLDAILVDWVAFARQLQPPTGDIDEEGLLDHGRKILTKIAADMRMPESAEEQQDKSEGNSSTASLAPNVPSRSHARQRRAQGFNIEELVAEYRALRATVLRLWAASSSSTRVEDLEDFTRFNEAVDQAIAESLQTFMAELDKARDLFLGVLGHDLRGPLSTISNIATANLHFPPEVAQQSAVLLRSVAQMKALLDDLVEYAKHRLSATISIKPEDVHLGEFARNTLGEIAAIRNARLIDLKVTGDLQGVWDARRLHQALSNLIFNALKYGSPDAPIIVILDGTELSEVTMAVQNSGAPIPAHTLSMLFDPLSRGTAQETGPGDESATGANMGLGLYVVQEIVKAHGGTVEVASNESFTRFCLRLPRKLLTPVG
ncbi:ATP-binding protein [Hydrogenophaga sp.]|uniref:ATP-binding protein n=1 Tax=Hydrogenophaga sp. TaxID=1904254 RepID=UPI003F6F961A